MLHLKRSFKRVNCVLNVHKLPSSARKETQDVLHAVGSTIGSTSTEHFVFSEFRIFLQHNTLHMDDYKWQ
jgi:hypothetical protein